MKVLLVNGSSRKNGCTLTALNEAAKALNEEGVETEFFFIGNEALPDCIACRKCRETGRCIVNDIVNAFVEKIGRWLYFRFSGLLCASQRKTFNIYGQSVLFRRRSFLFQACRCGTLCKARRDDGFNGCNQQVFYNQLHAYHFIHLLESGLRCAAGTDFGG